MTVNDAAALLCHVPSNASAAYDSHETAPLLDVLIDTVGANGVTLCIEYTGERCHG